MTTSTAATAVCLVFFVSSPSSFRISGTRMTSFRQLGSLVRNRQLNTKDKAKEPGLSPLDIPEVLEQVLSYLDDRTLALSTSLVCARWYNLGNRFLKKFIHWNPSGSRISTDAALVAIPTATRLRCCYNSFKQGYCVKEWDLDCVLRSLTTKDWHNMSPLLELELVGQFSVQDWLIPMYTHARALTRLVLWGTGDLVDHIHLSLLLHSCPDLVELEVSAFKGRPFMIISNHPYFNWNVRSRQSAEECPPEERIPFSKITSLVFNNVGIEQHSLQRLLQLLPSLKRLKLIDLQTWIPASSPEWGPIPLFDSDFNMTEFTQFLGSLPLELEAFHLSLARSIRHGSHVVITDSIPELEIQVGAFGSSVKEWSLLDKDFSLQAARTLLLVPNRITKLELLPSSRWSNGSPLNPLPAPSGLHEFLCHSPLLLHLYAGEVAYDLRHMDLNHQLDRASDSRHIMQEYPTPGIWACHGLQSLHLQFTPDHLGHPSSLSTSQSRVIFGYISRVCPMLRELKIDSTAQMDLSLDSGFCLLSRLCFLGKLDILVSSLHLTLRTVDLDWMSLELKGAFQRMRVLQEMVLHWRSTLSAEDIRGIRPVQSQRSIGSTDALQEPWEDTRMLGMLNDVKATLEELYDSSSLPCWSNLYSFHVRRPETKRDRREVYLRHGGVWKEPSLKPSKEEQRQDLFNVVQRMHKFRPQFQCSFGVDRRPWVIDSEY